MTGADLRYYFHQFCSRLPLIAIVGAVIGAIGMAYVVSLPPVYRATGTILVEPAQIAPRLEPVTESVGALARLQVIVQELLTHDALVSLAARHAIYGSDPVTPATVVADLRSRIHLEPVFFGGNENALGFSVSFDAEAAEPAARIANDLIAIILERDETARASQANAALAFFQEEAARLAQRVADYEQRLRDYKTSHIDALPDTLEFRRMLQINLRDRLLVLAREQSTLQSRRSDYVEYRQRTGRSLAPVEQTPDQVRLAALNATLADRRMMFAEDSPTLTELKQQIAALEARINARGPDATADPDTAAFDLELAEMDDRLAAIALEREALERSDEELAASIAATPANEASLNALEREYSNARSLYDAAAARLADASTGEQIAARLQGERLTLMEAARPPERPMGPKRMPLALGVAAAAILAGLGVAVGLELLNRTVGRAADIERSLGIEVLATIPVLRARSHWRLRLPRLPNFTRRIRPANP